MTDEPTSFTYDPDHPLVVKTMEFVDKWPGSDYGPAHLVLADFNFDDHSLGYCKALIDRELREGTDYPEHSRDELEATRSFLDELYDIPDDERDIFYPYPDDLK